jgi:hypothetical protein
MDNVRTVSSQRSHRRKSSLTKKIYKAVTKNKVLSEILLILLMLIVLFAVLVFALQ